MYLNVSFVPYHFIDNTSITVSLTPLLLYQEIASKELSNLQEQRNNVENEIRELEDKAVKLQALYNEQEELLSQIFGGE